MNTVPHEFVTVDMRGLKGALLARAESRRTSVSVVVRDAVAIALSMDPAADARTLESMSKGNALTKIWFRLSAEEIELLDVRARLARLSRSAYLSDLIWESSHRSVPSHADHLAAVVSSNAELSTLARNVRHLATLLGRSEMQAAQRYRALLDTVAGDVVRHLHIAGEFLKNLPRGALRGAVPRKSSKSPRSADVGSQSH